MAVHSHRYSCWNTATTTCFLDRMPVMTRLSIAISMLLFVCLKADAKPYEVTSYGGINFGSTEYSESNAADNYSFNAVYLRFGALFDHYYALEWRIGTGLANEDAVVNGSAAEMSIDLIYGAYARLGLPIAERLFPYALIGYSRIELALHSSSTAIAANEYNESDFSYGLGIDFALFDRLTINTEYLNYLDVDNVEISGFSVGISYDF